MHYELYIDVFFLVNFMMDYLVLHVTGRILKISVSHIRICVGALTGAFLTCVVLVLPVPYGFIKLMLFHGIVGVLMLKTGLSIPWNKMFLRAYVLLYVSSFLLGGVFTYFRQYMRYGSLFFVFAIVSYYVVLGIWDLIRYLARQNQYLCEVILRKGENVQKVKALIDTGNSLRDPLSGKPVSILNRETAEKLYDGDEEPGVRFISYHSIGKSQGVLPLVKLDRLEILKKEKQVIEHPYIAVSEEAVSGDGYEMILNPDIL